VNFITRAHWGALPAKAPYSAFTARRGIVVHHGASATPATRDGSTATVRSYQRTHLNHPTEPYIDIAYNVLVSQQGDVYEGRGFENRGGANGTSEANAEYLSVCFIGNGAGAVSRAAIEAFRWVIAEARRRGFGNAVLPHQLFKQTSCPGSQLLALLRAGELEPQPKPERYGGPWIVVRSEGEVLERLRLDGDGETTAALRERLERLAARPVDRIRAAGNINFEYVPARG
jgi:N-acetylmuramoyl-L-alanine amidase